MKYDLIIIGAGPVGLSAAIEAKKEGLKYIVLEKGFIVNSIYNFPQNMTFFTTASLMEIGGHPFPSTSNKPSRNMALDYYRLVVERENLKIKCYHQVNSIVKEDRYFKIKGKKIHLSGKSKNEEFEFNSNYVIIATGYFDNPRGLGGIKGEDLPHVSKYYDHPHPYFGQKVVVIGAGNSGAEAALELYRHGAEVYLVHNHKEPRATIKYWVAPDLKNRIANGEIKAIMPAKVLEITQEKVIVELDEDIKEIPADKVFVFCGFLPNIKFLKQIGIELDKDMKASITEKFESNIDGIFLIGSVGFGKFTNTVFIENGRDHAKIAITEISLRIKDKNYVPNKSPSKIKIKPTNQ